MEANLLRSVAAGAAEEADVGETAPSLEEFYEGTFRRLFTALCLVTGNRYEAEEVAQESFVRVFERWDHVGVLEDSTGYLFRVSMNVFRSRYRRASLGLRRALFLAPAATDDLDAVETHDAVVRLLKGLDPKQRAAIGSTCWSRSCRYSRRPSPRSRGSFADAIASAETSGSRRVWSLSPCSWCRSRSSRV